MTADERALRRTLDQTTERWQDAERRAAAKDDVNRDLARQLVAAKAQIDQLLRGYNDVRFTGYEFRHAHMDEHGKVVDTVYDDSCAHAAYQADPPPLAPGWHTQWRRLYTTGPWHTGVPEQAREGLGRGVAVWLVSEDPPGS